MMTFFLVSDFHDHELIRMAILKMTFNAAPFNMAGACACKNTADVLRASCQKEDSATVPGACHYSNIAGVAGASWHYVDMETTTEALRHAAV